LRKKLFLALVVLFLGLFGEPLSFSKEMVQEEPSYGDALVVGTIADASILVPMLATDVMSHRVAELIFRGIVKYAPDLSIVGDLAERYEVSKDQRVITFYLKKNAKWEDGTCLSHSLGC
jgi:peptide/nickel transport system substrate-binding protein